MGIGVWLGLFLGLGLVAWGILTAGTSGGKVFDLHGLLIVFGGTAAAALINCPIRTLLSAIRRVFAVLLPTNLPTPEAGIAEMVRLARAAQAGGGILSIQNEAQALANGFVHRAIAVAIATGESEQTRRIMERQIKQVRIGRQEDANVFRTIGMLSPMFGILGTLLGMIQVLSNITEPAKVGPAMALALSSAFLGIAMANFLCIPLAGQIRLVAMRETLVLELLLEGVLSIAAGKAPYLIEMHLASYTDARRRELQPEEAPGRAGA